MRQSAVSRNKVSQPLSSLLDNRRTLLGDATPSLPPNIPHICGNYERTMSDVATEKYHRREEFRYCIFHVNFLSVDEPVAVIVAAAAFEEKTTSVRKRRDEGKRLPPQSLRWRQNTHLFIFRSHRNRCVISKSIYLCFCPFRSETERFSLKHRPNR